MKIKTRMRRSRHGLIPTLIALGLAPGSLPPQSSRRRGSIGVGRGV